MLALLLACTTLMGLTGAGMVSAEEPKSRQVSLKEPENGGLLLDGQQVSTLAVLPGETVQVTAVPDEGYQTDALSVTDTAGKQIPVEQQEENGTFLMPDKDVCVSASFVPVPDTPDPETDESKELPEPVNEEPEESAKPEEVQENTENGTPVPEESEVAEETVSLYRYLTFYDTVSGDVNATVGFHVRGLSGTVKGDFIEAVVNDHPEWLNLTETDGYPKVILNYGMNQGRQTDITSECSYDAETGVMKIPANYRDEFLTVKSVLCDYSTAYQMLVPEEYRVNKNIPMPMLTYEDGPTDETDWAVYGVIEGSCNDTQANGDISGYQVGDRITVVSALTQTVARNTTDTEGSIDLYEELGMLDYRTGFGWTGFAVSLDCGEGNPFTNIGNPGTGNSVRTFPGVGKVALNSRNWMYTRCVTDDADRFSGNGRFTGGHIKVIGKDADGTLTCWLYLERTGPSGQAAQNIGMVFKVHPSNGSLEIRKASAMPEITEGNPCYSLKGAEYTVYQAGTDTVVGTITTDANGYGKLENLPAGNYEVVETKAPSGYLLDSSSHLVTVAANATVTYSCEDLPGNDPVTVLVLKRDAETGQVRPQVRLSGAQYTVKYYPVSSDTDPAENGQEPLYIWVFETDETGAVLLDNSHKVAGDDLVINPDSGLAVLPVGTITIQETKAPEGYLRNPEVYVANTAVKNGTSVVTANLPNSEEMPAREQIIRGDLEFYKTDAEDESPMAGIPFSITSEASGESHIILTDEKGFASTAANPHSQNTNRGETAQDGVWFGGGDPDDGKGALPYDTYLVEELPCAGNDGKDLLSFFVEINADQQTVELGTLPNYTIEIQTEARDRKTGTKTVAAEADAAVTDLFSYNNLTPGRTYLLKGMLMDADTGEELLIDGKPVTDEVTLIPVNRSGTAELQFSFDASALSGRTIVVFTELYWKDIRVAEHKDLLDESETVRVPTVGTTALDAETGTHVGTVDGKTEIIDTVAYTGLTAGKEYTLTGTLMVKETGEPLKTEEGPVTAKTTFVPEKPDGSVTLTFSFDGSELSGTTVVAFEEVTYQGVHVVSHADLEDEEQSVFYPSVQTEACGLETGSRQVPVQEESGVSDHVYLSNLIPGEDYTLQGVLIDAETGYFLEIEGKAVGAELIFTAEHSSETREMVFALDTTQLQGKTLVVYEYLLHQGKIVARHAERFDENQTVHIPYLATTALDQETESHTGAVKEEAVITDIVNYRNLVPGKEYTIRGTLMVKETGEPLKTEEGPVTAEETFTPEKSAGSVTLTYSLDSSLLAGHTVVVFEDLIQEGITLISHADLEDEEQSVHYPEIHTEAMVNGDKEAYAEGNTEIIDTVSYSNLVPGESYTLQGVLADPETGEKLLIHGKEVTASLTFTAEESSGEEEMTFLLDASGLAEKSVVVYETLLHKNIPVTEHADPKDEAQAVFFKKLPEKPTDYPETGDPTVFGPLFVGIALAGGGSCFFLKKKREMK